MIGFWTLFKKEVLRFWKVGFQTIAAPVLSALLYLLIFSHVLSNHLDIYPQISYTQFLIPGLVMMTLLQNAFANSSSSLIQNKITGSMVFMLLAPLSYREFYAAYVLAAVLRGIVSSLGVWLIGCFFATPLIEHFGWVVIFMVVAGVLSATLGVIAGIWADKFDQLAAFQNFLVLPLTMLSGVFYSIHSLPPFWQTVSHFNPFFYMIDGFRYGFFGVSDVAPEFSLTVVLTCTVILAGLGLRILASGYKLRA